MLVHFGMVLPAFQSPLIFIFIVTNLSEPAIVNSISHKGIKTPAILLGYDAPDFCTTISCVVLGRSLKHSTLLLIFICLFIFGLHGAACKILVSQPGIEPGPTAVKVQSPYHWTTREFPYLLVVKAEVLHRVALSTGCVKICKLLEQSAACAKLTINVGNIPSQSRCPLEAPDNSAAHRPSSPGSPLLKTIHLLVVGPGGSF